MKLMGLKSGVVGVACAMVVFSSAAQAVIINVPGAQPNIHATLPYRPDLDSTGSDTDQPIPQTQTSIAIGGACEILWFGTDIAGSEIFRFQSLGFNITHTVNPADVNADNLSNFDVLVVSVTGSGVLGGAQPDIEVYVNGGNGLLIHQPNFDGTSDYAPTNFNVTTDDLWCNYPSDFAATIVDPSHPITTGLTDVDLSGDFDFVVFVGSGYTLLAKNVVCEDPALAAGTSGSGRVVFETGNAGLSVDAGSDQYWINVLTWLCEAEPCEWDLDGDGDVGITDLLLLLGDFGSCDGSPADFDGDGCVTFVDLLTLLSNFGPCPDGRCPWDVNGDETVDLSDLFQVLGNLGPCDGCPEDVNDDGVVDFEDVIAVITHLGPCP